MLSNQQHVNRITAIEMTFGALRAKYPPVKHRINEQFLELMSEAFDIWHYFNSTCLHIGAEHELKDILCILEIL
jgi:hypothetical protein